MALQSRFAHVEIATCLSFVMKNSNSVGLPALPRDVVLMITKIACATDLDDALEQGKLDQAVLCCRTNPADVTRDHLMMVYQRLALAPRTEGSQTRLFKFMVLLTQILDIVELDLLKATFRRFIMWEEESPRMMYFMEVAGPTMIDYLTTPDYQGDAAGTSINCLRMCRRKYSGRQRLDIGFPIPSFRRVDIGHEVFSYARG